MNGRLLLCRHQATLVHDLSLVSACRCDSAGALDAGSLQVRLSSEPAQCSGCCGCCTQCIGAHVHLTSPLSSWNLRPRPGCVTLNVSSSTW